MADPTQRRFRGSAKISEYEVMPEKLGEGTFGIVSKAISKRTGRTVALKKILMHNEKDGFPITALREVKLLKMLCHPNILHLDEMAVEREAVDAKAKNGKKRATLYMVMPYAEHDLSGMLTNPSINFSEPQIKCYMQQLLEGLRYLHDSHILHRDMKAANILISNSGILQIADFGLARHYDGSTPQPGGGNGEAVRDYTSLVVTRWYRPPELLLTLKRYTPAIDLWGVGCIFGEMYERKPILEGRTDVDQCVKIFALLGSPTEQTMPGWSELPGCEGTREWDAVKGDIDRRFGQRLSREGLALMKELMNLDWRRRINAIDALQHSYFTTHPLPSRPEDIPKYEDSHELDSRNRGREQRRQPPAPAGGDVGMGPDEHMNGGSYNERHRYDDRYNDRAPRHQPYARERSGPPGSQPHRYDDRRAPPPNGPPTNGSRRPGWEQDERPRNLPPAPYTNGHPLPPKPMSQAPPSITSVPPPPPQAASRGGPAVDTYIPAYSRGDSHDSARDRDRDRRREYDRNDRPAPRDVDLPARGYRDADAPPPTRSYRDADAAPPPPRSYRDRDREAEPRGYADEAPARTYRDRTSQDRERGYREDLLPLRSDRDAGRDGDGGRDTYRERVRANGYTDRDRDIMAAPTRLLRLRPTILSHGTATRCLRRNQSSFADLQHSMTTRKIAPIFEDLSPQTSHRLAITLADYLPDTTPPSLLAPTSPAQTLPIPHHLVYFEPTKPSSEMLPDGTNPDQSPGPPFTRRMWAGGRVLYNQDAPLTLSGQRGVCAEFIRNVDVKGKEGEEKLFVRIERRLALASKDEVEGQEAAAKSEQAKLDLHHRVRQRLWRDDDADFGPSAILETRNIVFLYPAAALSPGTPGTAASKSKILRPTHKPTWSHKILPDPKLLFRFSALTFNAHAIHLDPVYCREVEGHRERLFHGPLSFVFMMEMLKKQLPSGKGIRSVEYRNLAPLYCGEEVKFCGTETGD
ncbi:serine/threonine protein kinase, CMGC, CDC2/CDK subfamily, partial [Oleoguttula sp. CCFEE 5521]